MGGVFLLAANYTVLVLRLNGQGVQLLIISSNLGIFVLYIKGVDKGMISRTNLG
jgi:hypothetical protein